MGIAVSVSALTIHFMRATEENLEAGLTIVAKLIDGYGEHYWPIFDFLEKELESSKTKKAALERYLNNSKHKIR